MSEWFANGRVLTAISPDDRALQYGDGVFETMAVRDGRVRFWKAHMRRLRAACARLDLDLPAESLLQRDVERALGVCTADSRFCTAKLVVSAGSGPRGYARHAALRTSVRIGIFSAHRLDRTDYENGVSTVVCETPVSTQPRLAGIKTLNRLDQVLARREWSSASVLEGLMFDVDGQLICGTMSNVFLVQDNRVRTPRLDRCGVAGIMRGRIIELLGEQSIAVDEQAIPRNGILAADEIFLANSQFGAVPVSAVDDQRFEVGDATRSVLTLLAYHGVPECRP